MASSVYPGALDTFPTTFADNTSLPTQHVDAHNNANDALNKIERELGINPKGTYASVAARLLSISGIPPSFFNVKDFGAIGDGVTNDAAAIQSAVNAAVAVGGGTVVLPAGTFKANTSILLPVGTTPVRILGVSPYATILNGTGLSAGNYVFRVGAGGTTQGYFHGIESLSINSNFGIKFAGAQNCYVENCFILAQSGSNNIGIKFEETVTGTENYLNIIRNTVVRGFNSANDINLMLHSSSGQGSNSNYIEFCWFGVAITNVQIDGADTCRILFNEFNGSSTTGIKLLNAPVYTKIIGNQFDGPTEALALSGNAGSNTLVAFNSGTGSINSVGSNDVFYGNAGMPASLYDSCSGGFQATQGGLTTVYKSGAGKTTVVDADFDYTPPNGTMAVIFNTTDSSTRFGIKANGVWKHATFT